MGSPSATVIGIYRHENAGHMRRLVDPAAFQGWPINLWALDRVHPQLNGYTVGEGRGPKFDLLNRILRRRPVCQEMYLIVADDDVELKPDVNEFIKIVATARLDLSQPGHTRDSYYSHKFTRSRPLVRARLTTFVEIGPLFAVSPEWRERVTPFPVAGMGWGLELQWIKLRAEGCTLGIVDAVKMRHLDPAGVAYDMQGEGERVHQELMLLGVSDWNGLQQTRETWRPWRSQPPWVAAAAP